MTKSYTALDTLPSSFMGKDFLILNPSILPIPFCLISKSDVCSLTDLCQP